MNQVLGFIRFDSSWRKKVLLGSLLMLGVFLCMALAYSAFHMSHGPLILRSALAAASLPAGLVFSIILWGYFTEFLRNVVCGARPALPSWQGSWSFAWSAIRSLPFLVLASVPAYLFAGLFWLTQARVFFLLQIYIGIVFYIIWPAFALDVLARSSAIQTIRLRHIAWFAVSHFRAMLIIQIAAPVVLLVCLLLGSLLLGVGMAAGAFFGVLAWCYLIGRKIRKELLNHERRGGSWQKPRFHETALVLGCFALVFLVVVVLPLGL